MVSGRRSVLRQSDCSGVYTAEKQERVDQERGAKFLSPGLQVTHEHLPVNKVPCRILPDKEEREEVAGGGVIDKVRPELDVADLDQRSGGERVSGGVTASFSSQC